MRPELIKPIHSSVFLKRSSVISVGLELEKLTLQKMVIQPLLLSLVQFLLLSHSVAVGSCSTKKGIASKFRYPQL